MAGFRDQLNKEIERRNIGPNDDAQEVSPDEHLEPMLNDAPKPKRFSFRSFGLGIFLGSAMLSLVIFWAYMNAEKTTQELSKKLSSKTVLVSKTKPEKPIKATEINPVKALPPNENMPTQDPQQPDEPIIAAPSETLPEGALVTAPIPGFYESVEEGLIPIIRQKDGMTPFDAYKKPFTAPAGKPILSFVINNVGLSKVKTYELIDELPDNVTFAFSPYAQEINHMVATARAGGHEVWLNIPLESKDYPLQDPGPLTLLKNASTEQNDERFRKILSSTNGYAGLIPNKDHAYTAQIVTTNKTIEDIYVRGLVIVDSQTTMNSFAKTLANDNDAPYGIVDIWLDDELTPVSLNKQIRRTIELGKAKNQVVVMLNNYPASINAMNKFLSSTAANDFQLAPLSAQVKYAK